jgi:hypothetical protein
MVSLTALWLPIVLASVVVFVASAVMHMVLKYHRNDFKALPNEARVLDGLRKENISPGMYVFPYCSSSKDMGKPEMVEKYTKGPVGLLTMLPSRAPSMGKGLTYWFLMCLFVSLFAAYLAARTVAPGSEYLAVFRVAGTVAFLGYCGAEPTNAIWRGASWSSTFKHMFDGLIYAVLTAGIFGWLWPAA